MKAFEIFLLVILIAGAGETGVPGQTAPAASTNISATPAPNAASPPSAPAERSQSDLEKLVAPIALYPDSLIATLLPASAYPLEIVQAARFVKDTNNISKLDTQTWDDNVKAIARFPDVISQMNDNIQWTSDLGDAFINQPKGITDAVQTMRGKAQESGALKTTPQQVVVVTNTIVTNTVESQIVYVTNQVVQIQPSQPDVMYVPQYNPTAVYAGYPVSYPGYYYPPAPYYPLAASAVSFGVGMACGAIIANNCDWGHGGCWGGSYHSDVNINRDVNRNVDRNVDRNRNVDANRSANRSANANRGQKWQPDQNRLKNSGSTLSSSQSREARGYGSGSSRASGASRPSASGTPRAGSSSANSRLSPTGPSASRPSSAGVDRSPNVSRPSSSPNANRPSSSPNVSRSSTPNAGRSSSPNVSRQSSAGAGRASSQSYSRPSSSQRSAFSGGGSGGQARQASSRGSASRGGGGGGGGGRGGGGGGRR